MLPNLYTAERLLDQYRDERLREADNYRLTRHLTGDNRVRRTHRQTATDTGTRRITLARLFAALLLRS